jgi:hypothetical protein
LRTQDKYGVAFLCVCLLILAAASFIVAGQRDSYKEKNEKLIVNNIALTKELNETKAGSYRMGIIACGNEDVSYLNGLASDYQGTALGKLFQQMAMNWTYDDDTLNQMVESYMSDGTH